MITQKHIADDLGISTATLKNWVHALNLTPPRNRSGRTKYDQDFIEVLYKVKDLRDKGTGLKTIREIIKEKPAPQQNNLVNLTQTLHALQKEVKEIKQDKIYQLEQQNQRLLQEIIDLHKELKKRPSHAVWQTTQDQLSNLQQAFKELKTKQTQGLVQRIIQQIKNLFKQT